MASFVRDGSLPLRELDAHARALFPQFGQEPLGFNQTIARISEDSDGGHEVRVRMSPYGESGHPLRGFYHQQSPNEHLIWVNLRHVSTAVAATLGHEVGHLLWDRIHAGAPPGTLPFYNVDFAAHLAEPRELFADAFMVMATYPTDLARQIFSRRGWPRSLPVLRAREDAVIASVYAHLRDRYGANLEATSGLSVPRRFHYITSMVYFAKVRAAVLYAVGL